MEMGYPEVKLPAVLLSTLLATLLLPHKRLVSDSFSQELALGNGGSCLLRF